MSKEELKQAKKEAKALLKKPFYKKWWFWLLIVIVIIIIASNSGGDKSSTTDTSSSSNASTNADKQETTVVNIGEVLRVGDVEFTVNSVKTASNVGGEYGSNAQGKYLIINTTVKNVSNEAITTDSSFFKLLSGEKTFEADSTAAIYANEDVSFFYEQINPDISLSGNVVFDVTDEVISNPDLLLQVQTGFFGTKTGQIKIGQ